MTRISLDKGYCIDIENAHEHNNSNIGDIAMRTNVKANVTYKGRICATTAQKRSKNNGGYDGVPRENIWKRGHGHMESQLWQVTDFT